MAYNEEEVMPVYLFLGFLEGGKTTFIQKTLGDSRFVNGDRTLLLICEEGEVEYDTTDFEKNHIYPRVIEDLDDLNEEHLQALVDEVKAQRVMIEYNGMWLVNELFQRMPDGWMIYQVMFFAQAGTFLSYNQNMRSLVVDKLNVCELVVFNRFERLGLDKMEFHKIVRGISRRTDIAYEYTDGKAEYDDIEDPLPFDVESDSFSIEDRDFALFYRDIGEELDKYDGKTVTFKSFTMDNEKFPKNSYAVGREIMTCCVEDIQYCWLVAEYDKMPKLPEPAWFEVTAKIKIEKHKLYRGRGPVLYVTDLKPADPPEQKVATFY